MHAYLIMAHNNFNILEKLLKLLDYKDNDIYIHIDKKVKQFDFDYFKKVCKYSNVYFTKKRIDVKWGTSSQIKLEMLLFKSAYEKHYDYYHLISGVDMPLKSQKHIHGYFEGKSTEYIFYHNNPSVFDYQRISKFHINYRGNNKFIKRLIAYIYILQDYVKIDRFKKYKLQFKRGFNWCSVTDDFVGYLLSKKGFIKKITFASLCADECYKQIILLNSKFKNSVFINADGKTNNLRFTVWEGKGSHPNILLTSDYDRIIQADAFFARKFDENVDINIVNKIYDYVKNQN